MWVYFTRFSIEKSNVITNLQANLMPTSNFNYINIVVKKLGFSMRHAIMYLIIFILFSPIFCVESKSPKHIFSNFFNCKLFCQKIVIILKLKKVTYWFFPFTICTPSTDDFFAVLQLWPFMLYMWEKW